MQSGTVQRIGLTGGIGSGKSTVADLLATCGACVIDADAISRRVTAAGGAAINPIAQQFGSQAITAQGAMDRDVMRQLVFDDVAIRRRLEAIIHPLVSLETLRQAEDAARAGHVCIVFDIPLLVESGRWRQQLDRILVVDCSEATQISRVTARSGAPPPTCAFITMACHSRLWVAGLCGLRTASGYDAQTPTNEPIKTAP